MSFRGYERPWRRKEMERADRQRQAQDAARRQRLGLAAREPARGSGMAMPSTDYSPTSAHTITFAGTGAIDGQIRYYWNNNATTGFSIPSMNMTPNVEVSVGDENATDKSRHAKPEREPSLREIWRD